MRHGVDGRKKWERVCDYESVRGDIVDFLLNLKRLRESKGLSRTKVVAITGMDHTRLKSYEEGRGTPRLDTLFILAKVYGVKIGMQA